MICTLRGGKPLELRPLFNTTELSELFPGLSWAGGKPLELRPPLDNTELSGPPMDTFGVYGWPFAPCPAFGVMGILNLTPDSFYDGGRHAGMPGALDKALSLLSEGADIIDLGAESTRPGAAPVPASEETARILPVLRAIKMAAPQAVLSIDCWKAETARAALEAGADMINDISAALFDPALAEVLAEFKPGYVLMHSGGRPETMQDNPRYDDVVDEVLAFFAGRMNALVAAGLPEDRIVLDPGIGFGKTVEHNLRIMRDIGRFHALGRPLLAGVSMKSLFHKILAPGEGKIAEERGIRATQIAVGFLAGQGVVLHRVHHVAAARDTLRLVSAIQGPDKQQRAG